MATMAAGRNHLGWCISSPPHLLVPILLLKYILFIHLSLCSARELSKNSIETGSQRTLAAGTHTIFEDDDRHNKDPEEYDAENPLTWYPTWSPSPLPTTKPPSMEPTKPPSPAPIESPSFAPPTGQPQSLPTGSPSIFPSLSPTKIVSTAVPTIISSSPTITIVPTKVSSESPRPSSLQPTCELHGTNATFGDVDGVEAVVLQYLYEMETSPITSSTLDEEVIPDLELAMAKFLIPNTFANTCTTARRLEGIDGMEGMIGMSTSPADLLRYETCSKSEKQSCSPIEGRMSLYIDSDSSIDEVEAIIIEKISKGMDEDKFLHAHSSIQKVIFIGVGNSTLSPPEENKNSDEPSDGRSENSRASILATVLTISGVTLILALIATRRNKTRQVVPTEESSGLSSHYSSIGSQPGDIETSFEKSNPHDLDTIRISNTNISDEMEVNVDLESFESNHGEEGEGTFDFFDLILERSDHNTEKRQDQDVSSDGVSDLSFMEI